MAIELTREAKQHIAHLHRGGKVGHYCEGKSGPSTWFESGEWKPLPQGGTACYFNVNPLREVPPKSKKGSTDGHQIRSQKPYLAGMNCLFAEIDGKDLVEVPQGRIDAMADELEGFHETRKQAELAAEKQIRKAIFLADRPKYKALALERVKTWNPQPSVALDSGGGWHCYWYLAETFKFNGSGKDLDRGDRLQKAWVDHVMIGSDGGAKNLNRILRVPGSFNHKYGTPERVDFVPGFSGRTYPLAELEARAIEVVPDLFAPRQKRERRDERITDKVVTAVKLMARLSSARYEDYNDWLKLGMILRTELGETGFELWREWSENGSSYNEGDCKNKWDTFSDDGESTMGTLIMWANEDSAQADDGAGGDPQAILAEIQTLDGVAQAQAVGRLAVALAGSSAVEVNRFAGILTANRITTKGAFVADVKAANKAREARAKAREARAKAKEARAFAQARNLLSSDYHSLFKSWGYDIRLNLCNDDIEVNGEILTDQVEAAIRQRARDYGIIADKKTNVGATEDSIRTLAGKHGFHPIKQYLNGLEWDGVDHLGALLSHFSGDNFLNRWLDTWLPGAVARVYGDWQNPMLVLDGAQGLGKSYLAQWLCSPLPKMFIESPICPDSKDHRLRLIENFVWEVQELGSTTRRSDQNALKAFLTIATVKERKSYGRNPVHKAAICSFVGTTNPEDGFLTDLSGNRRYLVTHLDGIDWGYSQAVAVGQLWAQAVYRFRTDESWKLTAGEKVSREEQNAKFMVTDPVQVFLEASYKFTGNDGDVVSTAGVLDDLQTAHNLSPTKAVAMRVSTVFGSWGATKDRESVNGKRERVYRGIAQR